MTNLTEQWNKGKLPNGWYYVRLIRGEHRIDLYINGKNEWIDCPDDIIDTIVCEVPSYEQWQELIASYEMSKNANLEQATWIVAMESENTKLKELLKGAKEIIEWYKADCGYRDEPTEVTLQQIAQVLGEE